MTSLLPNMGATGLAPIAIQLIQLLGKDVKTSKVIQPMAPAANPERFKDAAKTKKWFRINRNDVVGRECTPEEKSDVLSWLLSLRK